MKLWAVLFAIVAGLYTKPAIAASNPGLDKVDGPSVVTIQNNATGKCLSLAHSSEANGITLVQMSCDRSLKQLFMVEKVWQDVVTIKIAHSEKKCVDVAHISYDRGARLHQWDCHGGLNQLFRLVPTQEKSGYRLMAEHSSQCLNVMFGSQYDYIPVAQFPCRVSPSTGIWRLESIP